MEHVVCDVGLGTTCSRFENQQRFDRDEAKRIRKAKIAADRQERIAQLTAERDEVVERANALTTQIKGEIQAAGGTV